MASPARSLRLLLLADTHLGFDLPLRPRVPRRRRGPDFFHNFERALALAGEQNVDLVLHGGDVFHRPRVPAAVVTRALDMVRSVTARGIPFVLVPGNHDRSTLPMRLLWNEPGIYVFDRPQTHCFTIGGVRVALAGFPFQRGNVQERFAARVEETGAWDEPADVRLLCLHQTVEGATVGPADFVFRRGHDVVAGMSIPSRVAAVLSGHIHRRQVLRRDLRERRLGAPVIYPGSTERTSFAERDEPKGVVILDVEPGGRGGRVRRGRFHELPTRPMVSLSLSFQEANEGRVLRRLRRSLAKVQRDGVVQLKIVGNAAPEILPLLTAARLRELAPPTMNVELAGSRFGRVPARGMGA